MSRQAPAPQLAAAYGRMADDYLHRGWTADLLTFMFRPLPGSQSALIRQMEREVERVYGRFVTRVVRDPRAPSSVGRLPVWLGAPDLPVFKHAQSSLADVAINGGLHPHLVSLLPPSSRLPCSVKDHFAQRERLYVRPDGPLQRIHVEPVTHDVATVVAYALKTLSRGRVGADTAIILPRSRTEL